MVLTGFLDQLSAFVEASQKESQLKRAHINFTGGEPFLRKDFVELLKHARQKRYFTFGILSNGFLPQEDVLLELKTLKPSFIQISLEGDKQANDQIRGSGSFDKIVKAFKVYARLRIPFMVSFTANSTNYKLFPKVVEIARKYGAYKVWTDRYLPSRENDPLLLSTDQTKEFFEIILKEQQKNKRRFFSKVKITSNRALQFLVCGGEPYRCSAGDTLITLMPNGDVLPCRRLPIKIGNLAQDNLIELYKNNALCADIHNVDSNDVACTQCFYKALCRGGLKCLSFGKYNDYNLKDPNCWLK